MQPKLFKGRLPPAIFGSQSWIVEPSIGVNFDWSNDSGGNAVKGPLVCENGVSGSRRLEGQKCRNLSSDNKRRKKARESRLIITRCTRQAGQHAKCRLSVAACCRKSRCSVTRSDLVVMQRGSLFYFHFSFGRWETTTEKKAKQSKQHEAVQQRRPSWNSTTWMNSELFWPLCVDRYRRGPCPRCAALFIRIYSDMRRRDTFWDALDTRMTNGFHH